MASLFTTVSRDPSFRKIALQIPLTIITVDNVLNLLEDAHAEHVSHQQLVESPKIPPGDNVFIEVFSPTPLVVPHPDLDLAIPLASVFAIWIQVYRANLQAIWNALHGETAIRPQAELVTVATLFELLSTGISRSIRTAEQLDKFGFPIEDTESILADVDDETIRRAQALQRHIPGLPKSPTLTAIDCIWGPHLTPWENALYFLNTGQATLQDMAPRQQIPFSSSSPLPGVTYKALVFKPGCFAQFNRPRYEIPDLD